MRSNNTCVYTVYVMCRFSNGLVLFSSECNDENKTWKKLNILWKDLPANQKQGYQDRAKTVSLKEGLPE